MIRKLIAFGSIILISSISLLLVWSMLGTTKMADSDAMDTAKALYEDGNYPEAIQIYEQIVSTGVRDSHVLYNLGNAYALNGDIGRAILNYERAAEITPRDRDIRHNLALARSEAGISSDLPAVNPVLEISSISRAWVSLNEISVIALAAWITSGALILIYLILSKTSKRKLIGTLAVISLVITLGASITFAARIMSSDSGTSTSIVTKPNTILQNQPISDSEGGIELPAGTRTQVIDQQGKWVLLSTLDQIIEGWAPEDAIEYLAF
jgi:tetratricopeptide (TPR) repeat protein